MARRRRSARPGRSRSGRKRASFRNGATLTVLAILALAVAFGRSGELREGIAALLPFTTTSPSDETTSRVFEGPVRRIVDGDTFDVRTNGETLRIRLCGIDAPERGEQGYEEATETMRGLVEGRILECRHVGAGTPCDGRSEATSYDRIVAQCLINGRDIATEMVSQGVACDWPRFSGGHYSRVAGGDACVIR